MSGHPFRIQQPIVPVDGSLPETTANRRGLSWFSFRVSVAMARHHVRKPGTAIHESKGAEPPMKTTCYGSAILLVLSGCTDVAAPSIAVGHLDTDYETATFDGDENQPPVWTPIPNQTLGVGDTVMIDLAEYCTDPDGDDSAITYSLPGTSFYLDISIEGTVLTLSRHSSGRAGVIIVAADPAGAASANIFLTPEPKAPVWSEIKPVRVRPGRAKIIDLADFVSGDGAITGFTADTANGSGKRVRVARRGSRVKVTGWRPGTRVIEVSVTSEYDSTSSSSFEAEILPAGYSRPAFHDPPSWITYGGPGDTLTIWLYRYLESDGVVEFEDPEVSDTTIASATISGGELVVVIGGDVSDGSPFAVGLEATDSEENSASVTWHFDVGPPKNHAPRIDSQDINPQVFPEESYSFDLRSWIDDDSDRFRDLRLELDQVTGPGTAVLDSLGFLTITPGPQAKDGEKVRARFSATDTGGARDSGTLFVRVVE